MRRNIASALLLRIHVAQHTRLMLRNTHVNGQMKGTEGIHSCGLPDRGGMIASRFVAEVRDRAGKSQETTRQIFQRALDDMDAGIVDRREVLGKLPTYHTPQKCAQRF